MAIARYIPHYTVDEYRKWEGDWELWSGVPIAMSPSAKRIHQKLCGRLFRILSEKLDSESCSNCEVLFEIDWLVSEDTVLRPDLLVICDHKSSDFVEETPILVAEVLSESTRRRDLLYKRESYQQLGVKYYLIVDPKNASTQFLVNQSDGYRECKSGNLEFTPECGFELVLDNFFAP